MGIVPEFIPQKHVQTTVDYIVKSGRCPYCSSYFTGKIDPMFFAEHITNCVKKLDK